MLSMMRVLWVLMVLTLSDSSRAISLTDAPRAIILSNYSTPQHLKASADAGAEYFLDKSSDFERVAEILQRMKVASGAR